MPNPYHYGTPVSGEQFAGRADELAALERRMRDGINVVLSSPRRYGKTSLLARASADLVAEGAAVVSVNVLACRDLPTFAGRLVSGTYRVPGGRWHRLKEALSAFVSRLRVSPVVTFDGDQPRFAFSAALAPADAHTVIEDVYALLAEQAAKRPAVLVLDEFQAIIDLGPDLPALFKSLADTYPAVSLVVAGSRQHLMEALTGARSAPLYGLAERFALDVLPEDEMTAFLRERARAGGKTMGAEAAARVYALAGPVPNDVQRLAYEAWVHAGRTVTVADVDAAMASAVAHEASQYAERYATLSPGQRRVISAIAAAPVSEPYAASFAATVGLATAASVRRALQALLAAELVTRRGADLQVLDPFFRAWLLQTL